jgi:hypothetical protein
LAALALAGAGLLAAGIRRAVSEDPPERAGGPDPDLDSLLTCVPPEAPGPVLRGSPRPGPSRPDAATVRRPVTVRVLDARTRAALAGVRVEVTGLIAPEGVEPESLFVRETDAGGSALFEDLPAAGHAAVRAVSPGPAPGESGNMRAIKALHAELMALTSTEAGDEPRPLRPPQPWAGTPHAGTMATAPLSGADLRLEVPATLPLELDIVSDADGRPVPGALWRTGNRVVWAAEVGEPMVVAVEPAGELHFEIEVLAPRGQLAYDSRSWCTRIDPRARRLRGVYPLRRQASLEVVLPDSGPVSGSVWIVVAGVQVRAMLERAAYGRLQLAEGPHLPGDLVTLSGERLEASLTMPELSTPLLLRPVLRELQPPVPADASAELRELRALLHILPDGKLVMGPGSAWAWDNRCFLHYRFHSEVSEQGAAEAVAAVHRSDAMGATVHVVVTDASDRAVPFATLKVGLGEDAGWTDIDAEGAQRIDPFTDVNGRRTLRDLAPGRATVQASCGTRAARAHVALLPGEERTLRLRLPAVLPAPKPESKEER